MKGFNALLHTHCIAVFGLYMSVSAEMPVNSIDIETSIPTGISEWGRGGGLDV